MPYGTNPTITSPTYAGTFAGKYLAAALLSAPTLEQGGVTILPNVAYKQVLSKITTTGNIITDATCDFTTSGIVNLSERVLTTEEFQVNIQLCKADLAQTWQVAEMGYSSFTSMPKSFTDFVIAHVSARVAAKLETTIWNGTNATTGEFAGFRTLLLNDSDVVDVTASAITTSNVIGEIGKVVDAIPATLYGNEGLRLYLSQAIVKTYVRALGGFSVAATANAGTNAQGTQWYTNGSLSFDGIPIFMANGMKSTDMVATTVDNLFFGCGLLNDKNIVQVLDMAPLDGSQNIRVIMRYNGGVQFGIGGDIVLYSSGS